MSPLLTFLVLWAAFCCVTVPVAFARAERRPIDLGERLAGHAADPAPEAATQPCAKTIGYCPCGLWSGYVDPAGLVLLPTVVEHLGCGRIAHVRSREGQPRSSPSSSPPWPSTAPPFHWLQAQLWAPA